MKCHKCGSKDHLQDQCDQATHFAFGGYTLLQTCHNPILLQTVQNPRIDTPRITSLSSSSSGTNPPPMVDDTSSDGYAGCASCTGAPARRDSSSSESDDEPQTREQQYIAALTEDQYYIHLGPTGEDDAYQLQLRPRDPENAEYNPEDPGLPVRGEVTLIPTPTAPPAVEVPFPLPLFSDSDHESVHHPWSLYPSSNDDIGSENAPSAPPAEELNDDDLDTIYSERTASVHGLDSSGDNSERRGFGYHLHHTLDDSPTISEDLTNLPCVNPADDPSVSNFSSTSEETTTLRIEDTPGATWNVEPSSSSYDPLCCRCQRSLLPADVERNYTCWSCNKPIHQQSCTGLRCDQLPPIPDNITDSPIDWWELDVTHNMEEVD